MCLILFRESESGPVSAAGQERLQLGEARKKNPQEKSWGTITGSFDTDHHPGKTILMVSTYSETRFQEENPDCQEGHFFLSALPGFVLYYGGLVPVIQDIGTDIFNIRNACEKHGLD